MLARPSSPGALREAADKLEARRDGTGREPRQSSSMFYFTPRVKDALRYEDSPYLGGEHEHCSTVKKALPNLKFLFEALGDEAGQHIVFHCVADLDGIAADFTIFDVDLAGNGEV
jgi:hypothetical protein